jgi:aminoglycoside N3'-acetyltransferase
MLMGHAKALKAEVRNQLKIIRQRYARSFHSFTPETLRQHLQALGIQPGDLLLVHSSYDAFDGFNGKPTDVIGVLQELVGAQGVLMMPTMPFTGTAVEYARSNPVFDVARTPSRTGLLTELLRRSSGVVRSVHPTHPVAVWGNDAVAITAGHHEAATPCGAGSPFARLHEQAGKMLLLGADISSLTFYHWIEEALESRLPESPFTRQRFLLASRCMDGRLVMTDTRLFEPGVSRRRNLYKLLPELKRRGLLRQQRIGRLTMTLLTTKDVYTSASSLADQAIYCYD